MTILFLIVFIIGIYSLIQHRLNIKKAADYSENALFPSNKEEFRHILIPNEWKEMQPLSKNSRSYQWVKWGTNIIFVILIILLIVVLTSELLGPPILSFSYIFFNLIALVKHQGSFYILSDGLILDGKYISAKEIKHYEVEKIVRWHSLYGLHDRVNNGYKLSFKKKNGFMGSSFVVIEDEEHLKRIQSYLADLSIPLVETESSQ